MLEDCPPVCQQEHLRRVPLRTNPEGGGELGARAAPSAEPSPGW